MRNIKVNKSQTDDVFAGLLYIMLSGTSLQMVCLFEQWEAVFESFELRNCKVSECEGQHIFCVKLTLYVSVAFIDYSEVLSWKWSPTTFHHAVWSGCLLLLTQLNVLILTSPKSNMDWSSFKVGLGHVTNLAL